MGRHRPPTLRSAKQLVTPLFRNTIHKVTEMNSSDEAAVAAYGGYEYQILVSVWVALDLRSLERAATPSKSNLRPKRTSPLT